MSDIKAMMQAAKDKEAEVKAKFDEFDIDGSGGIDEVRTRTPSYRHGTRRRIYRVGWMTRTRFYGRAPAARFAPPRA
jgi:hypothetical protein